MNDSPPTPPPAPPHPRFSRGLLIGLGVTILLDTAAQLIWKRAAGAAPPGGTARQTLAFVLSHPTIWMLVLLCPAMFVNWMLVLSKADLSFAQPITALSYILVGVGSAVLLGEHVPPTRLLGIAVILGGVYLITGTPSRTTGDAAVAGDPAAPRDGFGAIAGVDAIAPVAALAQTSPLAFHARPAREARVDRPTSSATNADAAPADESIFNPEARP